LVPGTHASTFGGNPICCAAALAFIDVVEEEKLLPRAAEVGERLIRGLRSALNGVSWIKDVRGRGCLVGIELEGRSARPLLEALRQKRVLVTVSADNVMRLAPAFNIPWQALDDGILAIAEAVRAADKSPH
jgi:acetylornithine/succinyldiaminopimelate/putrescine aminotransferase